MATNGGKINFEIGFTTNSKGLTELKKQLNEIREMATSEVGMTMNAKEIQAMVKSANDLEHAMHGAFDVNLNTINVQKFQQILKQSGTDLVQIRKNLALAGSAGQSAFLKATSQLMQFNTAAKQTNHFLDSIATSFTNTVKWSIMSSIINTISSTIQKSYYYVKDLDSALNDIRIVTGKSADEMGRFAESANNAAKQLAVTTEDYTKGSLIYYQQGLDDETVKALTDITAKTSNVTGQSMSAVSEELTAVWNGYQVANEAAQEGMQVYEEYVDKMAAVGASTASNLEELSTAMSKVASAASAMGIGFDDLNAQIATIVSVTRQAPESVGTALKTIYARLGDLKVDGVDEFNTKLGEVSEQLKVMGIDILESNGDMRDMSDVMAEVAQKWNGWTEAQKQAAAVAMAGKRQYNNLIALFDNWDMYSEALATSMDAVGTLEEQQETALDSLKNKTDQLTAAAEDLYDSLYNEEDVKKLITGLTKVVQIFADFSDSIGGLSSLAPMLISSLAGLFQNQIANGLSTIVINARNASQELTTMAENANQLKALFADNLLYTSENQNSDAITTGIARLEEFYNKMQQYQSIMSTTEKDSYNNILNTIAKVGDLNVQAEEMTQNFTKSKFAINAVGEELISNKDKVYELAEEAGKINQIVYNLKNELADGIDFSNFDLKSHLEGLGQIDNIVAEFEKLRDSLGSDEKALERLLNKLSDTGVRAKEISKITINAQNANDSIKGLGKSLEDSLKVKQYSVDIVRTASALGQLASSLNSIKNIGNIWTNEDLSIGDKILQTMMNLGFVISGLSMAYDKLSASILLSQTLFDIEEANHAVEVAEVGTITTLKAGETVAREANAAAIMNETKSKELANLEDEKRIMLENIAVFMTNKENLSIAEQNTLINLQTQLKGKQAAIYALKNSIQEQENILTKTAITNEALETLTTKGLSIEKIKLAFAITSGKIALAGENVEKVKAIALEIAYKTAVMGTVAVLAVFALAIGAVNAARKKEHEQILQNNDDLLKEVKAKKELAKTNEGLIKSFDGLYKKYKEGKDVKEDLYNKTIELADAYHIEDAAILALSDRYGELQKKIKAARIEELDQNIKDTENAAQAASQNALEKASENKGMFKLPGSDNYIDTGSLIPKQLFQFARGTANSNPALERLFSVANFGVQATQVGVKSRMELAGIDSSDIDTINAKDPGAVKAYIDRLQAQVDFIDTQTTDVEKKAMSLFYKNNKKRLTAMKEYAEELKNQFNNINVDKFQRELLKAGIDSNSTAEEISAAIQQAKENLKDEDSIKLFNEEELNDFINSALSGIEGIEKEVTKINLAKQISDQTGEGVNDILKIIKDFNDRKLGLIKVYLDTGALEGQFQEWINKHQILLDFEGKSQAKTDLGSYLSGYNKDTGFSSDAIDAMFEDEEVSAKLKAVDPTITEEIFRQKDAVEQLTLVTRAYINSCKDVVDAKKGVVEEYKQELVIAEEAQGKATEAAENTTNQIQAILDKHPIMLKYSAQQVEKALRDLATKGFDNLDKETQKLIKDFQFWGHVSDQELKDMADSYKNLDEANALVEQLRINLHNAENAERDFAQEAQQISDAMAKVNEEIDKAQSSFKALVDIMSDYNETGAFTLDNVQALVEMDTEYAAALDFENGRLEINEEAFKANAIARLNQLKQTVELEYEEGLARIAAGNLTEAEVLAGKAAIEAAGGVDVLGQSAAEATTRMNELAAAAEQLYSGQIVTDAQKQAAATLRKAYDNKMKGIESAQDEILAGGYRMRRAMGAQTQEDKDKDKASKKDRSSKDYKYERDEIDRYWEINKALDEISRTLKKLDKIKSHVFGKQKIQVLEAESKLIQKQTEQYKRLYEEQKKEAEELKGQLTEGGISFSAAGEVLNYGQAMKNALDTYNKGVNDFNNKVIDEEGFKKIERNYEQFKKNIERYDKLFYTDMKDTLEKIEEEAQKLRDIELEKFEIKVQLKIDKAQLKKDFRNFRKELEKDFTLYYEILPKTKDFKKNFKDDKAQVKAYMEAAKEVQHEIDIIMAGGTSTMFASLTEAQEKLKEINKSFEEASRNTMQDVEDAWSNYIAMIDQANEKLEEQEKRYERVNAQLESFRQIMELTYGPKAYEEFDRIYQQQIETNQAQFESAQKEAVTYQKLFEKQLAIEGASADNMDTWSEATKKYYDQWKDSEQKIYDLTAERIQLLKDQYINTIDQISNSLEMDLTGGIGYDISNQEWELAEQRADLFYNETEKAYQLQTLNNKIQKDMNKSSLATQKKLQQFRDEKLKELDKEETLTKFQLEAAEAEYDILLKQTALEEAKNNKTSMKLTRNTEGNWSYQYVSDTDDVMDKQQELLDSWEKLRSLAQQTTEESSKALMDAMQSYSELMAQNEKDLASGLINEQQYEYQRKMLKEQYENPETGILSLLGKNYQEAKEKLIIGEIGVRQEVYDQDKSHYITFTDEEKAIMDDFMRHTKGDFFAIETAVKGNYNNIHTETENKLGAKGSTYVLWNTAARQMADRWSGSEKDSVKNRVNEAFTKMSNATVKYKEDVTKAMKQAGLDAKSFEEKLKGLSTETNKAKDAIDTYCDDINKKLPKAAKKVQEMIDAWNKVKDSISAASLEIEEYLKKQQDIQTPSAPDNLGIGGYNYDSGNKYGTENSGSGEKGKKDEGKYSTTLYPKSTFYYVETNGKNPGGDILYNIYRSALDAQPAYYTTAKNIKEILIKRGENPRFYWKKQPNTEAFATGGYTGAWTGNEGRLATLHQKELVLNAKDTENFLSATDTLRNLVSLDSSIEKSIANAISKMLVEMSHSSANNIGTASSNSENTNNIFNINAEFPNANDVNEIREAILSLPNLASQYIHRTGY